MHYPDEPLLPCFNTQPPEGGCLNLDAMFLHTAARRRLHLHASAHAGGFSFNTQPPEGGCKDAARLDFATPVSTHSRPKAAAPLWVAVSVV